MNWLACRLLRPDPIVADVAGETLLHYLRLVQRQVGFHWWAWPWLLSPAINGAKHNLEDRAAFRRSSPPLPLVRRPV